MPQHQNFSFKAAVAIWSRRTERGPRCGGDSGTSHTARRAHGKVSATTGILPVKTLAQVQDGAWTTSDTAIGTTDRAEVGYSVQTIGGTASHRETAGPGPNATAPREAES
jgi:hypothetical protein